MKYTFDQALDHSAGEFHALRERAEDKDAFDRASEWMRSQGFVCDTAKGNTKSRGEFELQFTAFDWGQEYVKRPSWIFYDFFQGPLLNKYSRIIHGID